MRSSSVDPVNLGSNLTTPVFSSNFFPSSRVGKETALNCCAKSGAVSDSKVILGTGRAISTSSNKSPMSTSASSSRIPLVARLARWNDLLNSGIKATGDVSVEWVRTIDYGPHKDQH